MVYDRDLDAIIAYGVELPEGFNPPWGEVSEWETGQEATEGWWNNDVCGLQLPEDEEGDEVILRALREFELAHPLPFKAIKFHTDSCPRWFIAVPGTSVIAGRGWAGTFVPEELAKTLDPDKLSKFGGFCKKYGIPGNPQWRLFAYYEDAN